MENNCVKCKLNYKKKVVGIGSSNPEIIFVNGCPVPDDELQGKPFSSDAGKLFLSLLRQVNFDLSKCYFTNLIQCVPELDKNNNYSAPAYAIKHCEGILKTFINRVKPKIVVLLGNTVIKHFLGTKYNSTNIEGIPVKKDNIIYVGTYSPDLLVKDIDKVETVKKTLYKLKDWLIEDPYLKWKAPNYSFLLDFDSAICALSKLYEMDEWACDIETDGLDVFQNKIYSISFASNSFCIGLPFLRPDGTSYWSQDEFDRILGKLKDLFSNNARKIFHNAGFDLLFLYRYGIVCNNLYSDTMILHYLLDSGSKNYGLKYLVWKVLGMGGYEQEYTLQTVNRSAHNVDTVKLLEYNANDAYATYLIYQQTEKEILQKHPYLLTCMRNLILPLQLILIETTYRGILLDINYIDQLQMKYQQEVEQLKKKLFDLVGYEFNLNSVPQLSDILLNKLKLPLHSKTKTQFAVTDVRTLNLFKGNPFIDLLLDYRKKNKIIATYFENFKKYCDKNNIIHPQYSIFGTVSGRLSSSSPNCQNIPRSSEIKNMFIARQGYFFVECDFSQIEYRMWCHYCRDEKMKQDIENGMDIHKVVASKVFNVPIDQVTDSQRKIAKFTVFGAMYGRGAKSIALEHNISEEQAKEILNFFFSMYPKANLWLKQIVALAKRQGYLKTFFGRIKYFPGLNSHIREIQAASEREAKNFVLQSTASDYTLFKAVMASKVLKKYRAYLVLTVHDSLIYEVFEPDCEPVLQSLFKVLAYPLKGINVKMDFEAKIGYKLGDLEKITDVSIAKSVLDKLRNKLEK